MTLCRTWTTTTTFQEKYNIERVSSQKAKPNTGLEANAY